MSAVHYLRDHQKVTRCWSCRASVIYVATARNASVAIEYATLQEFKTNPRKFRGTEHVCKPKEKR